LSNILAAKMPTRRINETVFNDSVPAVVFNRTGYEVKDLPAVSAGVDDGDDDFQEHIDAIQSAIDAGKADGFIDPDMEVQQDFERNLAAAYRRLLAASALGRAAFASKDETEDAIVELVEALKVGADAELVLGMKEARALLSDLRKIKPAIDELEEAIEEANVSLTTYSHMGNAQVRLNAALDMCNQLNITKYVSQGTRMRNRLVQVKAVYVQMKAAIVQGQISLDREEGEEAAIAELDAAVNAAKDAGLHRDLPVALDLLVELVHMNSEHQKIELAMRPAQQ
jgi:tetratricopeptide (TPR) repeat protein